MKKMTVIICVFLVFITLSSFLGFIFGDSQSSKGKIAHKITRELSKKFCKKYKLSFAGISEEAVDGKYKRIGIELDCDRILTKDQARLLLLNCASDALEAFNANSQFRKHMLNYPFDNGNIIINIYIQPPKISRVYFPDYVVFSFYNDILWYKTKAPQQTGFYYTEEKEDYEEALRIVELQKKKI